MARGARTGTCVPEVVRGRAPTMGPGRNGRIGHGLRRRPVVGFQYAVERAIRGGTRGVGHGSEAGRISTSGRSKASPGTADEIRGLRVTSRATMIYRPAGPGTCDRRQASSAISSDQATASGGTTGAGRSSFAGPFFVGQSPAGRRTWLSRVRRMIPRRSSSARTTRAAATSSGSRVIVPETQSM